ncbi:MAG: hypothetical protein O9309_13745 [Rhizobium sp.]|nr:hypothetical protein [Rhizobium sp.]MCZ8350120.1 hypothetical protein [Rhizobium sp.]
MRVALSVIDTGSGAMTAYRENEPFAMASTFKALAFAAALSAGEAVLGKTTRIGPEGLSDGFLAENRRYIESGCLADVNACPQTDKDITIANGLTIATMNAGAASTFSPFRCRAE